MNLLTLIATAILLVSAPQFQKLSFERLPELQTPRGVGQPVLLGDEVTVFGGHTTGYKPVETAEYYRDGAWHSIPMTYPHDGGAITLLPDGRVFLAGGNAEPFGIGQSWGAEIYDPVTHSFAPIGIMDRKRSLLCAAALPDGRVLIAGNWYGPDGIEAYMPGGGFTALAPLEPGLCYPYILRSTEDDVIVFSSMDSKGEPAGPYVHRLGGEPCHVPLLEEWEPIFNYASSDDEHIIADYTYLLLANRRGGSGTAILRVSGGEFSVLDLEEPIPAEGPSGDPVFWAVGPQVDRAGRLAWIQGCDVRGRIYFARIDYNATLDGGKASVRLYYAEAPEGFPYGKALLLPGGRFFLAGGVCQMPGETVIVNDNFNVLSSVYLFHTEEQQKAAVSLWAIIAVALLLCAAIVLIVIRLGRKKDAPEVPEPTEEQAKKLNADLMAEVSHLIEEKELFLRKDLRVADIAKELATNRTYMSILVNNLTGSGFSDLINGYRIRYAQQLMLEHPEMVHGDVAIASGFASRTAFLRTFKAKTGLSPTEWKESLK